jgi:hypothetical protein
MVQPDDSTSISPFFDILYPVYTSLTPLCYAAPVSKALYDMIMALPDDYELTPVNQAAAWSPEIPRCLVTPNAEGLTHELPPIVTFDHDLPKSMLDPEEMALDTVLSTGDFIREAMGMTHEHPPVESFQHNRPDVLAADEVVPGAVGMTHELPDLEPPEQDRREIGMDAGEVVPETVVVPRPVGRVLELPLLETFELPLLETFELPLLETFELPLLETFELPLVETFELPLLETFELPFLETFELPLLETFELPLLETFELPLVETFELPLLETFELPLLETFELPLLETFELPFLETFELNQPEVMIDAEEEIMPYSIVIAKEVVAVVPAPAVEIIQVCYPRPSPSVILGANFAHTKTFNVYNISWVTNDPEILSLEEFRTLLSINNNIIIILLFYYCFIII